MITFKCNSHLARWAFWYSDKTYWAADRDMVRRRVPPQTTLCNLFWRAFFFAPLIGGLPSIAALALLWWGLVELYRHPLRSLAVTLGLCLVVGSILGLVWLWDHYRSGEPSVFLQGLKAVKGKFCPLIKFD